MKSAHLAIVLAIAMPAGVASSTAGCGNSSRGTDARANDDSAGNDATGYVVLAPDAHDAGGDEPATDGAGGGAGVAGDARGSAPDGTTDDARDAATAIATTKPCATLSASGDVLLELGHGAPIVRMRQSGPRVLSEDGTGHWVVWDTTTRTQVASGDAAACTIENGPGCVDSSVPGIIFGVFGVELAGTTVAVGGPNRVTLLSAADGQPIGTVPWSSADGPWGLASDGSYVWTVGTSGLRVSSSQSGHPLVSRAGNYFGAQVLATPQELLVAMGPAGQGDAIERISLATGQSTVGAPLNEAFYGWFLDGSRRYLTAEVTTESSVRVFASDGTLLDHQTIPAQINGLSGQGQFFWTLEPSLSDPGFQALKVYKLGGAGVPVRSVQQIAAASTLLPSGHLLAIRTAPVTVLDLSTDDAKSITTAIPAAGVFAADLNGNWSMGDYGGVVFGGGTFAAPGGAQALDCGQVQAIAGATTGAVAVSTASGQTLSIDLGTQRTLRAALVLPAGRLQLAADGRVLAALTTTSLQLVELPSMVALKSWPVVDANSRSTFVDFSLASGGTRLGQTSKTAGSTSQVAWSFRRWVEGTREDGTTVDDRFTVNNNGLLLAPVALSPDGTLAAVCDTLTALNPLTPEAATQIFSGNTMVASVPGYPVGWLDDQHLVLWRAAKDKNGNPSYAGMVISDAQGNAGPLIPVDVGARSGKVSAAGLYDVHGNKLYSLTDGHVLWPSGATPAPAPAAKPAGDVAGSRVVFASGHQVMVSNF